MVRLYAAGADGPSRDACASPDPVAPAPGARCRNRPAWRRPGRAVSASAEPMGPFRSDFDSHHDELHLVSGFVHEQGLTVKLQQGVESGIAIRHPHRDKLSLSDNQEKADNERSGPPCPSKNMWDMFHILPCFP